MTVHQACVSAVVLMGLSVLTSNPSFAFGSDDDGLNLPLKLETVCTGLEAKTDAGTEAKKNCEVLHFSIGGIDVPLVTPKVTDKGFIVTKHLGQVIVDAETGGLTPAQKLEFHGILKKLGTSP